MHISFKNIKRRKSYKAIHSQDNIDYSSNLTKEELVNYLYDIGISNDGKSQMPLSSIQRKSEKWLKEMYNNIKATNNLVNITKTTAQDLNIIDTYKYEYLLTYSFPCQDLSLIGQQKGMGKNSNTSSSMLWEVERLLEESNELPQYLSMENVPQVIGAKNIDNFNLWLDKLKSLGYKNYYKILNAKDYNIPQNRKRCFMISILTNKNYEFPLPIEPTLTLNDIFNETNSVKIVDDTIGYNGIREYTEYAPTLRALRSGLKVDNGKEIRKLTPIEYWRLMGFNDEDINKCIAAGVSNTQLYKQAGNSICVPVLEAIFKNLFNK